MLQSRGLLLVLLLLPWLVYLPAVTHHYGLRDDYSLIREAHEEPGKAVWFTGSHGRPVYGTLIDFSFRQVSTVDQLVWLRIASLALMTWLGLVLWRLLCASGWEAFESAAITLLVLFLPASQITISWTVGWPWGFALIMAVGAVRLVDCSLQERGWVRAGYIAFAVLLYNLAGLMYQSDALFAVVPIAAMALVPTRRQPAQWLRFMTVQVVVLVAALTICYILLQEMFAHKWLVESGRLQFEADILSKLIWFASVALPNAVTFFTLRDDFDFRAGYFWYAFACIVLLYAYAVYRESDKTRRFTWLVCLLVLPWLAHAVSLVAAERTAGYRTMFALSGLAVVLLVAALRTACLANGVPEQRYRQILSVLVLCCAWQAYSQTNDLIGRPQEREWEMINNVVAHMPMQKNTDIYLIEPMLKDRSTTRVYRD